MYLAMKFTPPPGLHEYYELMSFDINLYETKYKCIGHVIM